MFIYILKLSQNKYYVGKTTDINRRYNEHVQGTYGSAWTRKYKTECIIEFFDDHGFDELATTLRYMKKYGIENVRGADYCNIRLTKQQIETINFHMRAEDNCCFICGEKGHFIGDCPSQKSWWQRLFDCCRNHRDYVSLDDGGQLLNFGRHKNDTYKDVYMNDKGYCRWVLNQNSPANSKLKQFQNWLKKN